MNLDIDEVFLDVIGPEAVMILREPTVDMKGFVVVDSSLNGIPMGGVRIAPDLTLNEIIRVARSMTLKFCSYNISIGGGQAGIISDPNSKKKDLIIESFGESIKPLIKEDVFYPEPGLGTKDKDIERILKISGEPDLMPRKIGIFKYDIPLKKNYIGVSVAYCLQAIYEKLNAFNNNSQAKIDWNDPPRILLEGFGRVGNEFAKHIEELGYKILGVSTLKGCVFDEDGLDIKKLLELKEKNGDNLVNKYEGENVLHVSKEKIFELSSEYSIDFIIPGARPDAINKMNVDSINSKAIIPAANAVYEEGLLKDLKEKNVLAFPDFISNAGDVLALSTRQKVRSNILAINSHIKEKIREKTIKILKNAREENLSPYEYARKTALNKLEKKLKRKQKHFEKVEEKL